MATQWLFGGNAALNILDLPAELIMKILSPLPEAEIFWNVGFTCKRLLHVSLSMVRVIEMALDFNDIENTLRRIHELYSNQEILESINHIVICQDYRKNSALYDSIKKRHGKILLICGRLEQLKEVILITILNRYTFLN